MLLIYSRSGPLQNRFMGRDEDINVADVAPRLQTVHLKQEKAHKLVLHLVHLSKPHGYALELDAGREPLGKLVVHQVEDEAADRVAEGGGGWADGSGYVILEGVTLDEIAALAQYCPFQDTISHELDNLPGSLGAQKARSEISHHERLPLRLPAGNCHRIDILRKIEVSCNLQNSRSLVKRLCLSFLFVF